MRLKQLEEEMKLWGNIEKDVKRTRQEIQFFHLAVDPSKNADTERLKRQGETKKKDLSQEDLDNYIESHSDALSRILFLYAKLNPGILYIQGMNEILAVLYYVFW